MRIDQGNGVTSVVTLEDGNLITGTVQDCTSIVEHTKALHNEGHHGSSEFKHAAKLPSVVIETYMNVHNVDFAEIMRNPVHVRSMLNDPALKDFRIWPGRV